MNKHQLISVLSQFGEAEAIATVLHDSLPLRNPAPNKRRTSRCKLRVDTGVSMLTIYVEVGFYEDGDPCEVWFEVSKDGTLLNDLFDGLAQVISIGLQHGVPLQAYSLRGTGNALTGESNAVLDSIFKTLEELCTTPLTTSTRSGTSTESTMPPSDPT